MKNLNLSSKIRNTTWQILGERQLPVEPSIDHEIQAWLTEILHALHLRADFLNRILLAAQDSVTRAIHAATTMKFEHIHLMIFVPENYTSNDKTWGFFRIEKLETLNVKTNRSDHSIEFYLYLEG